MTRPIHAVHQQDVLPAIIVVIKKRAARAKGLGKEFSAEGSAVMLKADSRRSSDIGETKTKICGGSGEEMVRREGRIEGQASSGGYKFTTLHECPSRGSARGIASWKSDQTVAYSVDHQLGGLVNAERIHDVGTV